MISIVKKKTIIKKVQKKTIKHLTCLHDMVFVGLKIRVGNEDRRYSETIYGKFKCFFRKKEEKNDRNMTEKGLKM